MTIFFLFSLLKRLLGYIYTIIIVGRRVFSFSFYLAAGSFVVSAIFAKGYKLICSHGGFYFAGIKVLLRGYLHVNLIIVELEEYLLIGS